MAKKKLNNMQAIFNNILIGVMHNLPFGIEDYYHSFYWLGLPNNDFFLVDQEQIGILGKDWVAKRLNEIEKDVKFIYYFDGKNHDNDIVYTDNLIINKDKESGGINVQTIEWK